MSWLEISAALELGLIYGIVAVGIYLSFRVIDFPDLTVDGSFVAGAAISAIAVKSGLNPALALVLACIYGAVAGGITGFIHIYCKISNLLAGIITAFMLYSLNLRVMGGVPNITLSADSSIFAFYSPVITLAVIAILVWLVISYKLNSEWGLAGRSVGLNPRLAGSYGVSIKQVVMLMLMISNGLIGFAGGLFAQNQDFVDISSGVGTVIIGLAAVVIGEKLFNCRSITMAILSCILGSVIYRFIISAALYGSSFGLATSDLNLVTGLLVIAAQMLPKVKRL